MSLAAAAKRQALQWRVKSAPVLSPKACRSRMATIHALVTRSTRNETGRRLLPSSGLFRRCHGTRRIAVWDGWRPEGRRVNDKRSAGDGGPAGRCWTMPPVGHIDDGDPLTSGICNIVPCPFHLVDPGTVGPAAARGHGPLIRRTRSVDLLGFARSHRGVGSSAPRAHAPTGAVDIGGTARRQALTPLADRSDDGGRQTLSRSRRR